MFTVLAFPQSTGELADILCKCLCSNLMKIHSFYQGTLPLVRPMPATLIGDRAPRTNKDMLALAFHGMFHVFIFEKVVETGVKLNITE